MAEGGHDEGQEGAAGGADQGHQVGEPGHEDHDEAGEGDEAEPDEQRVELRRLSLRRGAVTGDKKLILSFGGAIMCMGVDLGH